MVQSYINIRPGGGGGGGGDDTMVPPTVVSTMQVEVFSVKVTEGVSDSLLIPDTAFMPLTFAPLAILPNYGKCTTFKLSNAVQLLAKTAPRERKLGPCPSSRYLK